MSLVRIELITGRHHQIRVQFSSRGYPLMGDARYGKMENYNICLCSYQLSFYHPTTKKLMEFEHFPEKNDIWKIFF